MTADLRKALEEIVANAENGEWTLPSSFANRARAALAQSRPVTARPPSLQAIHDTIANALARGATYSNVQNAARDIRDLFACTLSPQDGNPEPVAWLVESSYEKAVFLYKSTADRMADVQKGRVAPLYTTAPMGAA